MIGMPTRRIMVKELLPNLAAPIVVAVSLMLPTFVALEAVLTVFGSVWLLGVTQRRLAGPHRWGPALSRSAYGAFMLQAVFLLGLAVALRPVPVRSPTLEA